MAQEGVQTFVRLRSHGNGSLYAPPELRPRLVADVAAAGTNLTAVVCAILSERYKVPVVSSARRTAPPADLEVLNLRLPIDLYRAVGVAAAGVPWSVQREIVHALCQHYGLPGSLIRYRRDG